MTEEEAKKALFKLNFDYMMLPPKERELKYKEYQENRAIIRQALIKTILEQKEKEEKTK